MKHKLMALQPRNEYYSKSGRESRFILGSFPLSWEQRKLSELATMHARIGWQNLRTSEFLDSGDYMLITGTDFEDGAINYSTCHYVEKMRYDQDTHIQIDNGSILITKDGTLGKVAYVQGLSMPATLILRKACADEGVKASYYCIQAKKPPSNEMAASYYSWFIHFAHKS